MNCPSCETTLTPGQARCLACGALVAPAVQGALAPKIEPLRELPGARKKEKTWREEVHERVREDVVGQQIHRPVVVYVRDDEEGAAA